MNAQRRRFAVRLSIPTLSAAQAGLGVPELQEELDQRPHLSNPQVRWEVEPGRVLVEVDVEGVNPEQAAAMMAEELFEVAAAVLPEFDVLRVEVVDVLPLPAGGGMA